MEKLIINENLRLEMGNKGRELFLSKFEFEKYYEKIKLIYGSIEGRVNS